MSSKFCFMDDICNELGYEDEKENEIYVSDSFSENYEDELFGKMKVSCFVFKTKIKDFDKRITIWGDVKKSNDSSSSCGGSYVNGYQKYLRNKLQEL